MLFQKLATLFALIMGFASQGVIARPYPSLKDHETAVHGAEGNVDNLVAGTEAKPVNFLQGRETVEKSVGIVTDTDRPTKLVVGRGTIENLVKDVTKDTKHLVDDAVARLSHPVKGRETTGTSVDDTTGNVDKLVTDTEVPPAKLVEGRETTGNFVDGAKGNAGEIVDDAEARPVELVEGRETIGKSVENHETISKDVVNSDLQPEADEAKGVSESV